MTTEAKLLRLAEMAHRDGDATLIEAYALSILADAERAGGKLPRISQGPAHDIRGLADALVVDAPDVAPLLMHVLDLAYPLTDDLEEAA